MKLLQEVYNNQPWLENAARTSREDIPPQEIPKYVAHLAREHGVNPRSIETGPHDTLVQIQARMRFLDTVAGTSQHEDTIGAIEAVIREAREDCVARTDVDADRIDTLLRDYGIHRALEIPLAREKIINCPNVSGFTPEADAGLSNDTIRSFLLTAFGQKLLIKSRMLEFERVPGFMISYSLVSGDKEGIDRFLRAAEASPLRQVGQTPFYLFPTREAYERGEAILEGAPPDDIKHIYRNRGLSADTKLLDPTKFADHTLEELDFDYLSGLDVNDTQRRQLYILGSLAHEVGHALLIDRDDYRKVIQQEKEEGGVIAATEYANEYYEKNLRHSHRIDDEAFVSEDFCESLRIYVTNPDFMKTALQHRYSFIKLALPYIEEGSALELISSLE